MSFNCNRCHAPLSPGMVKCPKCGETFPNPVPATPGVGDGAPAKKGKSAISIVAIVLGVGCLPVIAILAAILFPVIAQVREQARITSSTYNLKVIGFATNAYARDNGGKLPPMDSMDHFKAALASYMPIRTKSDVFVAPGTNIPYTLNGALSGQTRSSIEAAPTVAMAREAAPHARGLVVILYADGHVGETGSGRAP